jgi:hypothetical protein
MLMGHKAQAAQVAAVLLAIPALMALPIWVVAVVDQVHLLATAVLVL